jgi:hypothetical protein
MRDDFEQKVLQNPALGATVLWQFARDYSDCVTDGSAPHLKSFVLVYSMLFHAKTVRQIKKMRFESGLIKALNDDPEIAVDLQIRVQSFALAALNALNVACATGLLVRESERRTLTFRPEETKLPPNYRRSQGSTLPSVSLA